MGSGHLSLADATTRALEAFRTLEPERVSLRDAFGRRAARAFVARAANPPFDASAMDGYAVVAADLLGATRETPITLKTLGESRAGATEGSPVERGLARRIFTGAAVPNGATAVLIQEDAETEGATIRALFAPSAGQNIRLRGSDFDVGAVLVEAYAPIHAGEIAVLASQDVASVDVVRRPTVAIVSTGDELRDIGEPARPGSIVGTNAYMLEALVRREGGIPRVFANVVDEPSAIAAAMREALTCDVVVTTGGVSVGDHDHVPRVLESLGVETVFAKVRMKPGKPVVVGLHGRTPVIGLPGNPASAMVGFELFVAPGLRRMHGHPAPFPMGRMLPLESAYTRSLGRPELARGRMVVVDGNLVVRLTGTQRSGSLTSMLNIDCLALFGGDCSEYPAGSSVFVVEMGGSGVLPVSPFEGRPELRDTPRV